MSQEKRTQYIRLILPPIRPGQAVLNLQTGRIERVSGHGQLDGTIRTLQSGDNRLRKDNVVALGDAPKRLAQNIIPFLFNLPSRSGEREAA